MATATPTLEPQLESLPEPAGIGSVAKLVPRVTVLIPAHNEHDQIADTLAAICRQRWLPDTIMVLTDNAPDDRLSEVVGHFVRRVTRPSITVSSTLNNRHRKAGNLNACLAKLLPTLDPDDIVMGFDADSTPDPEFIRSACLYLTSGYSAIGATFHGRKGGGPLGLLQRAEFARFARHQHRRNHADVMSGTGWAMRVEAMRAIAQTRPDGRVYNVHSIVEDYELTLALRRLRFSVLAPGECGVVTDVMTTMASWVSQRLRWQQGTVDELRRFGWTSYTREMVLRQILTYVGSVALPLTAVYLIWSYLLFGISGLNPMNAPVYWALIGFITIEQAWQARKAGKLAVLSTLLIVPEIFYSVIRQYVYIRALYRSMRRKHSAWGAGTEL